MPNSSIFFIQMHWFKERLNNVAMLTSISMEAFINQDVSQLEQVTFSSAVSKVSSYHKELPIHNYVISVTEHPIILRNQFNL